MNSDSPHTRSTPSDGILSGLSRLHPFVLLTDREGHVRWMNERLRDELRGEETARLSEHEQLASLWDDALDREGGACVQLDIRARNGTRTSVEASVVDFDVSDSGSPCCVVIARPQGEGAAGLREQTAPPMLAQVLDRSPNGVVAIDTAGYITYANPAAASLLGRRADELVGRPTGVFLAQSPDFEVLLDQLCGPSGLEGVVFPLDRNGERVWLSASTRPIEDEGGIAGVVTYLEDVTQRHRVEDELKQKNRELESYVDSVAHDLRSPLVSLLGFTRLLREDYGEVLDDPGHHFLDRVEQAGRTMDALIHDLLELSRIRKPGDIRPPLDPRPVLQQLAAELKLRLEEQGVELELPEAPPMIRVDSTRLYQLFSNLVGNALVHGFPPDHDRAKARIRIDVYQDDDGHEIVVADNGVGIPVEDQDRIFEVLQTGRGVRRAGKSHGIGLAIVKKIATSHGGRVWVESAPQLGSRFHVRFPAR